MGLVRSVDFYIVSEPNSCTSGLTISYHATITSKKDKPIRESEC